MRSGFTGPRNRGSERIHCSSAVKLAMRHLVASAMALTPPDQSLPTGRTLALIAAALVAITIAAAGTLIWDQRQSTLDEAQHDIIDLGVVLAEQTARSLQAVDLVLRVAEASIRARTIDRPDEFSHELGTPTFHNFLQDQ